MQTAKHIVVSPSILYWGTPVVLITSQNEDGTSNIAPMSSAWWLGHSCMLGLAAESKTTQNIMRTGECVLNLPDESMVGIINKLADTTGSNPVLESKLSRNYNYVKDKWERAGLSPRQSDLVSPRCISECPVQMECQMVQSNSLRPDLPDRSGFLLAIEVRVLRIHMLENLRMPGYPNRVDPDQWRPLIMAFQEFYGLGSGKVAGSVLGRISEEKYRGLTKSDVKKLPGDDDDSLATEEYRK
ncbi:putative flavin reductase domain protein fmn-binding protein [Seiridium unicorne]|uniref:Flavin reductase domain protein fmn-binding protein n=1 Tax=Seiridium unicorne TaxID=138068 RepID=A0ABR2UYY4_9PEZI